MTPAQHKKKGPNREHRYGAGRIPSEGQVRNSHYFIVKALIQAELQDSKADDRAPEVDDKAAGKRPVV